jgi:hypothetical protein
MRTRLVQLGACPIKHLRRTSRQGPLKLNPALSQNMSGSSTHEERTAAQQRDDAVHLVKLDRIEPVNETIRLLQFRVPAGKRIKASLSDLSMLL